MGEQEPYYADLAEEVLDLGEGTNNLVAIHPGIVYMFNQILRVMGELTERLDKFEKLADEEGFHCCQYDGDD